VANLIELANIALSRVGADSIESLDEATPQARACKTHLPLARDSALRSHDWGFARKEKALALLNETSLRWAYVYQAPSDCLAARRLLNESTEDEGQKIPFEIGISDSGGSQTILTNQEAAVLIYTAKISNPVLFDALFADALAWWLASELAIPLRSKPDLQVQLMKIAMSKSSHAQAVGSNEQHLVPQGNGSILDSRA